MLKSNQAGLTVRGAYFMGVPTVGRRGTEALHVSLVSSSVGARPSSAAPIEQKSSRVLVASVRRGRPGTDALRQKSSRVKHEGPLFVGGGRGRTRSDRRAHE